MLRRRQLVLGSMALGAPAMAETPDWPNRAVTVIVPWPPGGPTDVFARVLSQRLTAELGQAFVVDNRGGASGTIGMAAASRAKPDGYTAIIVPNSTYAIAPHLYQLSYDPLNAFTGVGLLVSSPLFMMVPRNSPASSVADYIALAKKPGSRQDYANAGIGATSHLATEMFLQMAGIEVNEIGYRGGGPAIQAALAGEAGMLFMPAAAVMPYIQAGDLRALAATTTTRSPLAPEVPTFQELGYAGFEVVEHVAMMVPAGTPDLVLRQLNHACAAALRAADMQPRLQSMALTVEARPREAWDAYFRSESEKWRHLVQARGIRMQ